MSSSAQAAKSRLRAWSRPWTAILREREEQVFLALTLVIGALVGATVVAFILLTERFGARLYPAGGMGWLETNISAGSRVALILRRRWKVYVFNG